MNTSRRNLLVALGGSAAVGGIAFGAGAFSTVEAERTATVEVVGDDEAVVAREPVKGENRPGGSNPYADTDDNGNLVINVGGDNSNGVNPNALTRIPKVFLIRNDGTQEIEVAVTPYSSENDEQSRSKIEDVVFYAERGGNTKPPGEEDNVGSGDGDANKLRAPAEDEDEGEKLLVGIDIDSTPGEPDVKELSVIEVRADPTDGSGGDGS
jgi:hypothetical protein